MSFDISSKYAERIGDRLENLQRRFDGMESDSDKIDYLAELVADLNTTVMEAIIALEAKVEATRGTTSN
jgi:hypothetical protein